MYLTQSAANAAARERARARSKKREEMRDYFCASLTEMLDRPGEEPYEFYLRLPEGRWPSSKLLKDIRRRFDGHYPGYGYIADEARFLAAALYGNWQWAMEEYNRRFVRSPDW